MAPSVCGLKVAVAPCGKPLTARVTVPLSPATLVTATAYVAAPGAATVSEIGNALTGTFAGIGVKLAATPCGPTMTRFCCVDIPLRAPEKPVKTAPLLAMAGAVTVTCWPLL